MVVRSGGGGGGGGGIHLSVGDKWYIFTSPTIHRN